MLKISEEKIEKITGEIANFVFNNKYDQALKILKPILDNKISFSKLDKIGKLIGKKSEKNYIKFYPFFDKLINYNAMGSYVIVGRASVSFLNKNFSKVMEESRKYIISGDVWYVCDIIGERNLGYALIDYFDKTILVFKEFLKDENRWVRRSVGVSIHFFSKRVTNEPQKTKRLLKLVEPYRHHTIKPH